MGPNEKAIPRNNKKAASFALEGIGNFKLLNFISIKEQMLASH